MARPMAERYRESAVQVLQRFSLQTEWAELVNALRFQRLGASEISLRKK